MIDSLAAALPRARESRIHERLELAGKGYALATLHRPANVDDPDALRRLLSALAEVAAQLPVVFPDPPADALATAGGIPTRPASSWWSRSAISTSSRSPPRRGW